MDDQNRNLILATVLSFLVIVVWYVLFPQPEVQPQVASGPVAEDSALQGGVPPVPPVGSTQSEPPIPGTVAPALAPPAAVAETGQTAEAAAARVAIETDRLSGSISLRGGRIDDLDLKTYRETIDPGSDTVTLLVPEGEAEAYYALFGWSPGPGVDPASVPGATTLWQAQDGATLTPETPLVLTWQGDGLSFTRNIAVDEDFMFTVTDRVENTGDTAIRLAPYGLIARHGEPSDLKGFFIIHEGAMRQSGVELDEIDYDDIADFTVDPRWRTPAEITEVAGNGWIGFTDHYWMTTLIPDNDQAFTSALTHGGGRDVYSAVTQFPTRDLAPGASTEVTQRLFAGAKEWETIRAYERDLDVYRFIDSIDWGWFFFLTKPIFSVLHWLNAMIGNMGWAIVLLTFGIKALLFPLAYKSYVSMAKMKELQPEMEKIKERTGDDRMKLQAEMMALYKKERVNPAAGCLPILLQIPIFFSLYKVIFVTLELRHAPWIGWIRDLSAPDPSSLFNLWGLLPWAPPETGSILALIFIGIMPLVLGISMWLQQKLNPAPTDPTQQMIFAWMPWVFMFMLGSFASGLVLYWITNNTLTFIQQYAIMRSHGMKPDVFGNIRSGLARRRAARAAVDPSPKGVAKGAAKDAGAANRPGKPAPHKK